MGVGRRALSADVADPGVGVVAACAYVIVLELVVSWGLLARRAWIFWAAFAQFLLFHALSWQVVGFFYPLLMFAILTIFPVSRLVEPAGSALRFPVRSARPRAPSRRARS